MITLVSCHVSYTIKAHQKAMKIGAHTGIVPCWSRAPRLCEHCIHRRSIFHPNQNDFKVCILDIIISPSFSFHILKCLTRNQRRRRQHQQRFPRLMQTLAVKEPNGHRPPLVPRLNRQKPPLPSVIETVLSSWTPRHPPCCFTDLIPIPS